MKFSGGCEFVLIVALVLAGLIGPTLAISPQDTKHAEPQIFAKDIISTGHEFSLTFTPDGKDAYFTRSFPDKKVNHVMHSQFRGGQWQTATPISFSSDQWSDLDPALSPNGKRLLFISTRPAQDAQDKTVKNMDIWYSDWTGSDWGEPHYIKELSSPGKEGSPTVDTNGTLCFFSDRNRQANSNSIYCSELVAGKYTDPQLMADINSGVSDTSPSLSADGQVMLFYSTRDGGYGKADLYVSFKQHGKWSVARNFGSIVNTGEFEYNPTVSRDGKTLYFGRNGYIYWVPVGALGIPELIVKHFQTK
jgi:Tol biopolymer transport system component